MLTSRHLRMHIAAVTLKTEELKKDERFPVLAVKLVLEPLTHELAQELGSAIAGHCFTNKGAIRDEMTRIQVRLREKPQIVTCQMAADVSEPTAVLRHVRVPMLTITKRELEKEGTSKTATKRVAPQAATLRMTVSALVDPAERTQREFFCRFINDFMLFSWDPEEKDLFADMRKEDEESEDGEDEGPRKLPIDADAGDVLDDQKALDKKKGRLGKGDRGAGPVH